jgi:hydrogenase maturation protease
MLFKGAEKFLVVGIGNPLRSDDGVGTLIVEKINEQHILNVATIVSHQLNIELLEEVPHFEKVVLVDASFCGEGLSFKKVQSSGEEQVASTHHLSPELFLTLAKKLYHYDLNLYLCSIRGQNFDVGSHLSPEVKMLVPKAIEKIYAFLKEE